MPPWMTEGHRRRVGLSPWAGEALVDRVNRAPDRGCRDKHQVLAGPLPGGFFRYQLRQMRR